jgi:hypothetical protein
MDRQRVCLVAAMMEHIHRPDTQSSQQPIESFTVTSDLYNLMRKKTALASCYGTTFGRYYVGWETNKQTNKPHDQLLALKKDAPPNKPITSKSDCAVTLRA